MIYVTQQLLARLGARPDTEGLEPALFGPTGPQPRALIELYGEDGTGKTQTLIHLVANAVLPRTWRGFILGGHDVGVIVIDTEYHFCMLRLSALLENRISHVIDNTKRESEVSNLEVKEQENSKTVFDIPTEADIEELIKQVMSKLYVIHCNSSTQLLVTLRSLNVLLSNNPEISIIMVDSVSAFYWMDRSVYGDKMATIQGNPQKRLLTALEDLISTFGIVIIVTRAILFTHRVKEGNIEDGTVETPVGKTLKHKAEAWNFMGQLWQQSVTCSYFFSRLPINVSSGHHRNLFTVSASDQTGRKQMFCISDFGIEFLV